MPSPTPRAIEDHEVISQVGVCKRNGSFKFNSRPRQHREPVEEALSWLLGRMSPRDARLAAFGSMTVLTPGNDAVRHVEVGTLRSHGFRVDHDPSKLAPLHVSVRWMGEGEWDDNVAEVLHSCCEEGVV